MSTGSMEFSSIEELNLRYIDQQSVRLVPSCTLNSYPQMPKNDINFDDVFDIGESEINSERDRSNFFSRNNIKLPKDQKQQLTIYLKQNLGNLKARRKTIHHIPPAHLMKSINNISLPNNYAQLIHLFLNSNYFVYFLRFVVLVNVVGISLTDYSFRVEVATPFHLSSRNVMALCLQLFANCVFSFEIVMRLYEQEANLKEAYLIINIIGTIATWTTIFFDMMQYDSNAIFRLMMMIRISRAIIRMMQVSQWLRTPFEVFIKTIPSLQKLFFPLVIIALFYALTGMALFSGSSHYICAQPVNATNHQIIFCGSSMYSCPDGAACIYLSEKLHPNEGNQYNLVHFDNIGNALLTVYHFVYNSNYSVIRGRFSSFINPYVSSVYFISMSVFFFYIFSNLIMISMSKAYMEQIENKIQKPNFQRMQKQVAQEVSLGQKVAQIFTLVIVVLQSIVIAITYDGMTQKNQKFQSLLDFILSFISLLIVILVIGLTKQKFFRNALNIIDLVTLLCHFLDIIICGATNNSIIYSKTTATLILRSVKILRIIRIIYFKDSLFAYQKYVIGVFFKTVFKVKAFLLLCLCFAFMFKQFGQLLFAYQIRFNSHGEADVQNGSPYVHNFQSFSQSLFTVLYLFVNQLWSETMYQYYAAVGWPAVFFFVTVVFVAHMMLIRLYIAVFLSYFKEELHKKSKQQLIRENTQKLQTLRQIQRKKIAEKISHQKQSSNKSQLDVSDNLFQSNQGNCFRSLLSTFYTSKKFYYFINITILIHSITIIVRNSSDSANKTNFIEKIENICFSIYILQAVMGCFIDGVYSSADSYLRKSKSNIISLIVAGFALLGYMPMRSQLATQYVRRITILKIFTLFRSTDKEMSIILDTISNIMGKFFNFILIYALLLFVIAIIPLKFLCNQTNIFNCQLHSYVFGQHPQTQEQCLALGGNWEHNQNFANIFTSVALLYQLASSQSWSSYVEKLFKKNQVFGWELFFIALFFIYNICFLNIVMGFIVQTYIHLKDKAYNLNLLKQSQRCWVLIKNSIHCLTPKPIIALPPKSSSQRKLIFSIINSQNYPIILDYMAYFNASLYMISYSSQSKLYGSIIQYCKNAIMFGFLIDVIFKIYALKSKYFDLSNSHTEFLSGMFIVCYSLASWIWSLGYQTQHIMNFLLTAILLLRCKSLLLKYSWCKTHLNSVIDILPKCGKIIKLVCSILFFYAAIGLVLFRYFKKDKVVDNYNIGYDDFLTAVLTLVRVCVTEGWYQVVSAFMKHSTSAHPCYSIGNYPIIKQDGGLGCGSWISYPYFLSFHVVMVLLVLNLLIATMASAYDDNYEIQYNSVNIFQLEDCLNLWQKYDPQATGVVQYKKFWRLTSQIAILFGISKKKLIKRKNKFFEELDLQIFQKKHQPILCYRFHDVITKFSKIKLQVANLRRNQNEQQQGSQVDIEFDISPVILKQIKDYITPFPDHLYTTYKPFKQYKSGQTKYIFGLLKKIRHWKHLSTQKKRPVGGAKLSSIFQLVSKKNYVFDVADSDQIRIPSDN